MNDTPDTTEVVAAEAAVAAPAKSSGGVGLLKTLQTAHGRAPQLYRAMASELRPGNMNTRLWDTSANIAKVQELSRQIYEATVFDDHGNVVKSGVLEPIKAVNEDGTILTIDSGETRWRAVRLLEGFDVLTGESVEAKVKPDTIWFNTHVLDSKTDPIERRFGVLIANEGRPFTDLEYAGQIKALLAGDLENNIKPVPQQVIAERLGKEPTWVSHINKLNKIVPDALMPFLREGQIKTTTVIEVVENLGADLAVELIVQEIESGKGQAAGDYEEAMAEARAAQAEVVRLAATPGSNEVTVTGPGRRPPTPLEQAQRRVAAATSRAGKAKDAMERGPSRITSRAIKDRAAGKNSADTTQTPSASAGTGKVSRANYAALWDAVKFVAANSASPTIRDMMNETLKRCGHPVVAARVDDNGVELPVEGEASPETTMQENAA